MCGCGQCVALFIIAPTLRGCHTLRRRRDFFLKLFLPKAFFFWCISLRKCTFQRSCCRENRFFTQILPIFIHFYPFLLFLVFSLCTGRAFFGHFPIFLGFVGISWGTPTIFLADFGAIMAIFDHFWAIFGPILFCRFFTENPENPRKIRCHVWQDLL